MEKFDAKRRAIGAPQDLHHLPHARRLEAKHVIDEDGAVEITLGEPVACRIKLRLGLWRIKLQRIEIGMEMATRPEGADHH